MTIPEESHTGIPAPGIGAVLRAARTKRGLSLAEMRVRTKIDARYLTALEADRFADLPPLPFARGFLRTYAVELGLDPGPLVESLAACVNPAAPRARADELHRLENAIRPGRPMSPLRRAAVTAVTVGVLTVAVFAVFFILQVREFNRQGQPGPETRAAPVAAEQPSAPLPAAGPSADGPSAAAQGTAARGTPREGESAPGSPREDASRPDATAQSAPTSGTLTDAAAATTPQEPEGITVDVQAIGRSWIRVQGEEGQIYEGVLTAGQTRRWQSVGPMTIRIGNAAAVVVTVNGRAVGTLGRRGQVVSRTFTKDVIP